MKVAYFVDSFPVVTETFVINQIAGVVHQGHGVTIYSKRKGALDHTHPNVKKYQLLEKTLFLSDLPQNYYSRTWFACKLIFPCLFSNPIKTAGMVIALVRQRYGKTSGKTTLLESLYICLPQMKQTPYDILHCQFGTHGPSVLSLNKAGKIGKKLVTSFRGHDATQDAKIRNNPYSELFSAGDLFLPVSVALKDKLISMGCDKSKIHVLHSGIDCHNYRFSPRTIANNSTVTIVTIARFVEMKGLEYGIECMKILASKGYKFEYKIVGDGPLRTKLETLIRKYSLNASIQLLGWKSHPDILRLLDDCDIMLAPSITASNGETEGIPNAVKEAMATGTPVVATIHGGIPELVQDGVSGFLVPERDANALAEKISDLIDNPGLQSKLILHARQFIEDNYEINKLNIDLLKLYESLLTR